MSAEQACKLFFQLDDSGESGDDSSISEEQIHRKRDQVSSNAPHKSGNESSFSSDETDSDDDSMADSSTEDMPGTLQSSKTADHFSGENGGK